MHKKLIKLITLIGLISSFSSVAFADWTSIGPGFDYQEFIYAIPVGQTTVYVARMSRDTTLTTATCTIDSMIANGRFNATGLPIDRETVSGMANRYDDTIGWWGQHWGDRYEVVAAINGDYWDTSNATIPNRVPQSGQIQGGWVCKRFRDYSGGSGFGLTIFKRPFLGGNVLNGESLTNNQYIKFYYDNSISKIDHLNVMRSTTTNDFVLYTPQYAPRTFTNNNGVEILVQMTRPDIVLYDTAYALGTVIQVQQNIGSSYIPFDCVVLSATGSSSTMLLNKCHAGDTIGLQMQINDNNIIDSTHNVFVTKQDWTKTYASIGGAVYCVVSSIPWSDNTSKEEYIARRGRTAVAFNSNYVYFVVVDGGQYYEDHGMQFSELGSFCAGTLQAEFAIAQDGGGSSALWVNGVIKNHPSDGSERATVNGLMMVNVLPMSKSSTVPIGGYLVTSTNNIAVRLGPGTNYDTITTLPIWTQCTILSHTLNGVYAKGKYWWKCEVGNIEGWIAEESIEFIPIELIDFESGVTSYITEIKKQ